jgi:hypothetical protein
MKPGPKPGKYSPTKETREKMRRAKLGKEMPPETRQKIRQTLLGLPKSSEHRDKLSEARLDLDAICLMRFEEMRAGYPGYEEFFDANKGELLYAMRDLKSEKELRDLREYVEVSQIESRLAYEYSSSSVYAAEDTMIALIDAKRLVRSIPIAS